MVMDGTGRVQKRGERMRELHIGGIEFAGPGMEHWHGASPTEAARYINQGLSIDGGSGTYWMEEVTEDDYLGNDIGIASRTRFPRDRAALAPEPGGGISPCDVAGAS